MTLELVTKRSVVSDEWVEACAVDGCTGTVTYVKLVNIRIPRRGCPVCAERHRQEAAADRALALRRAFEARLEAAHVPERFAGASLAAESGRVVRNDIWPGSSVLGAGIYVVTSNHELETIRVLRQWSLAGSAVVLAGPKGRGKSLLAAGLALDELRRGVRLRWVSWQALEVGLAASFESATYERTSELVETASTAELVILDDLGLTQSNRAMEAMQRIIARRYDSNLRLLITTNMSEMEAKQRLNEAIYSRLAEMVSRGGAWVNHEGPGFNARLR